MHMELNPRNENVDGIPLVGYPFNAPRSGPMSDKSRFDMLTGEFEELVRDINQLNYNRRMPEAIRLLYDLYSIQRSRSKLHPLDEQEKAFFFKAFDFIDSQYQKIPSSPKDTGNGPRNMNQRINGDLVVVHYLETGLMAVKLFSPPSVEMVPGAVAHDLGEDHRDLEKIMRTHNFGRELHEFVSLCWDNDIQDYAVAFEKLVNGLSDYKDGTLNKRDVVARKKRELHSLVHIYQQALADVRILQIKMSDRILNVRDIGDLNDKRGLKMRHETFQAYLDTARPAYFPERVYGEFERVMMAANAPLPAPVPMTQADVAAYMMRHIVQAGRELVGYLDGLNPEYVDTFRQALDPTAQNGFRKYMNMDYAREITDLIFDSDREVDITQMWNYLSPATIHPKIKSKLTEWRFAHAFLNYEPTAEKYTEIDSRPLNAAD